MHGPDELGDTLSDALAPHYARHCRIRRCRDRGAFQRGWLGFGPTSSRWCCRPTPTMGWASSCSTRTRMRISPSPTPWGSSPPTQTRDLAAAVRQLARSALDRRPASPPRGISQARRRLLGADRHRADQRHAGSCASSRASGAGSWRCTGIATSTGSASAADVRIVSAPSPVMEVDDDKPTCFHIHTLARGSEGRLCLLAPERMEIPGARLRRQAHGGVLTSGLSGAPASRSAKPSAGGMLGAEGQQGDGDRDADEGAEQAPQERPQEHGQQHDERRDREHRGRRARGSI